MGSLIALYTQIVQLHEKQVFGISYALQIQWFQSL
jgi:hypothetical protein